MAALRFVMIGQTTLAHLRRYQSGEARQAEPGEDRRWPDGWQGAAMARSILVTA
jgi:hypothetical protein